MVTKKEVSLRRLLNVIGIFIFGGLALSIVTNPIPSDDIKEFLLFIFGSAIIYYFLVNIYFIGHIGRKIFFTTLILLGCFSLYMIFYLSTNSIQH
ncbi:hypothetical protein FT376_09145 [Campylobacter jejuni]|nr:hypothetical protein [Campylobacter jejuni]